MNTRVVSLNNKKYLIDLDTWRDKDIIDFAPRATVPGGSVVMSDLGLYQPLVQTDWQHGFGFHWYSDFAGYLATNGNVDTRQDGLVMLMTKATSSDTNNNAKEGFVTFNNTLYSWGAAGLRKFNGTVWSNIYSSAAVNFALATGDYLFFCPDGARIQKMTTGEVVSDAGLDSNATDYKWLIIHNGYIFAGKDGTNQIYFDGNADLSQLEGSTADTDIIYCGIGNVPTIGAVVYAGNLYIARQDGLWVLGEDRVARKVIDLSNSVSSANFRSMAVVNGFLLYSVRNRIMQYNGARVSDASPNKITDTYPYVTYGRFDNFVESDNFLYYTARTNETTYTESLLCWDGTAHHKLMDLVTNGTDTISGMGYDVVNNRLWYHLDATADITYYIPFQDESPFPYADFSTTGTHSLITSRHDMGFRRVQKSMVSLLVEARNCTNTRNIKVYYQLDGSGTWVLWDTIKTNGVVELKFPGNRRTQEFNYILLRFDFVTDSAAQSPVLEGYTIRFIMRPNVALGFNFWIVAAGSEQLSDSDEEMTEDDSTAPKVREQLIALRDSKAPIKLIDILGEEHIGYLTSIQGVPISKPAGEDEEEEEGLEFKIQVNFVELH